MARLMSVAFTEQAVRDRTKTVTRRKGWAFAKPGDRVTLCRKVMGRKKGEPLERICDVEIVSIRRERLGLLLAEDPWGDGVAVDGTPVEQWARDEVTREGFPGLSPEDFVDRFFVKAQRIFPDHEVTRIEWRYLDDEVN